MIGSVHATSIQVKGSASSSNFWRCWGTTLAGAASGSYDPSCTIVKESMSLTLLQELVTFPITPDDESSEAGSDAGADGALLSIALLLLLNEQLAAQTMPEERQQVPTAVPAADDKAAEQVRQSPPAWQPQHAASPASALML